MSNATEEGSSISPGAVPPAVYYKVDDRKITLREFWNIYPSWKVLIPWIAGRLNVNAGTGGSFRRPAAVAEMAVAEADLPPLARSALQRSIDICLTLGFSTPRYYKFVNLRGDVTVSTASLLHSNGNCVLRLMHSLATGINPPMEKLHLFMLSQLRDGTYFVSTNNKPQFRSAPGIQVNRLIGAFATQVNESHQQHLARFAQSNNPAERVSTVEQVDDLINRYERYAFEAGVKRGLYVEMTPTEIESERRVVAGAQSLAAGAGEDHSDVLLQLSLLQTKKAGWGGAILILLISLSLFIVAGSRQWSWSYLLILLPLLFFHELGHYAAMRFFHYRNLRMFFIPFLGAAVAGQHYNVPGWKKVMVSLMGPVPGILVGGIIAVAGILLHNMLLLKIALVALILNGSNLLPLLPLDGGWVFHALLFCRNPMVEAVFRVVAAFGLMAFGLLIHSKILMYLGIPILLSVGSSYRLAKIATRLRAAGLPPVSMDDQNIPPQTAQAIITELKKTRPGKYIAKHLAQQTLQVFEIMNARPPGWAATAGLLMAHLVSLGLAGLLCLAVVAARHNLLFSGLTPRLPVAHRPLVCADTALKHFEASTIPVSHLTLVAHFASATEMNTASNKLRPDLPVFAQASSFGNSLFILSSNTDPSAATALLKRAKRLAKEAFVATTNAPAMLCVSALLPSEGQAQELADELAEYFNTDPGRLVPPWLPNDPRTDSQRAAHRLARQTYMKADSLLADVWDDPALEELQTEIRQAARKGEKSKVKTLRARLSSTAEELMRARLSSLASSNAVNPRVVEAFRAGAAVLTTEAGRDNDWREGAFEEMGFLTRTNLGDNASDSRFSCRSGGASRKGARLEIAMATLNEVSDGASAIAAWLCQRGASDLKYDITSEEIWSEPGR